MLLTNHWLIVVLLSCRSWTPVCRAALSQPWRPVYLRPRANLCDPLSDFFSWCSCELHNSKCCLWVCFEDFVSDFVCVLNKSSQQKHLGAEVCPREAPGWWGESFCLLPVRAGRCSNSVSPRIDPQTKFSSPPFPLSARKCSTQTLWGSNR